MNVLGSFHLVSLFVNLFFILFISSGPIASESFYCVSCEFFSISSNAQMFVTSIGFCSHIDFWFQKIDTHIHAYVFILRFSSNLIVILHISLFFKNNFLFFLWVLFFPEDLWGLKNKNLKTSSNLCATLYIFWGRKLITNCIIIFLALNQN